MEPAVGRPRILAAVYDERFAAGRAFAATMGRSAEKTARGVATMGHGIAAATHGSAATMGHGIAVATHSSAATMGHGIAVATHSSAATMGHSAATATARNDVTTVAVRGDLGRVWHETLRGMLAPGDGLVVGLTTAVSADYARSLARDVHYHCIFREDDFVAERLASGSTGDERLASGSTGDGRLASGSTGDGCLASGSTGVGRSGAGRIGAVRSRGDPCRDGAVVDDRRGGDRFHDRRAAAPQLVSWVLAPIYRHRHPPTRSEGPAAFERRRTSATQPGLPGGPGGPTPTAFERRGTSAAHCQENRNHAATTGT